MRYVLRPLPGQGGITVKQFLQYYDVHGQPFCSVVGPVDAPVLSSTGYLTAIDQAVVGTVTYFYWNRDAGADQLDKLRQTQATLVFVDSAIGTQVTPKPEQTFVHLPDAKAVFMSILLRSTERVDLPNEYFPRQPLWGPNVFVEAGARIARTAVLEGNNYVHGNVTIGERVVVKAGAVLGGVGFGFMTTHGQHTLLPHIGTVVLEDDVLVGSNTCIDCGVLGETRIGRGTKVDNLVHIAHNVQVGEDALVIANAMLAGSVRVGDRAQVAPSVSVLQQVSIGAGSVIGLHSCVTRDVPPDSLSYGVPAVRKGPSTGRRLEDNK